MRGVLAAAITELLELETAGGRLFVLRRRVIALFALTALQCHNFTHLLILPDFFPQGLKPLLFGPLRHPFDSAPVGATLRAG